MNDWSISIRTAFASAEKMLIDVDAYCNADADAVT